MHGGNGDDWIESRGGRDRLHGDAGNDMIMALGRHPTKAHAGDGDDHLRINASRRKGVVADAGGGDDEIVVGTALPEAKARTLWLRVNTGTGTVRLGDGSFGRLVGWDDVIFETAAKIAYRGSDQPDTVGVWAGRRLKAWTFGGDDVIDGSGGNDRIDAGAGDDRVNAYGGHDVCINAERQRSCEE